jgi:hypothetical protein
LDEGVVRRIQSDQTKARVIEVQHSIDLCASVRAVNSLSEVSAGKQLAGVGWFESISYTGVILRAFSPEESCAQMYSADPKMYVCRTPHPSQAQDDSLHKSPAAFYAAAR